MSYPVIPAKAGIQLVDLIKGLRPLLTHPVIPVKTGIPLSNLACLTIWIPTFAGMTNKE
jgi:hypothetical protein